MRLILHIGTEKTGTTAIQDFLGLNRELLGAQKVYQPACLDGPNSRILAHVFQSAVDPHLWSLGIRDVAQKMEARNTLLNRLSDEIKGVEGLYDVAVISSEQFQSRLFDPGEVSELRHFLFSLFDDVKIICYLRGQVEMHLSIYSTLVKQGYTKSLRDFGSDIEDSLLYYDHEALIARWGAEFGEKNLILREFSKKKLRKSDVVEDFMHYALDLPIDLSVRKFPNSNKSLGVLEIYVYRIINKIFKYADRRGKISKINLYIKNKLSMIIKIADAFNLNRKIKHHKGEAERIKYLFKGSNHRISSKYFGGELFE